MNRIRSSFRLLCAGAVIWSVLVPGLSAQDRSGNFWEQLTRQQRQTIRQTVQEMRKNQATPEEIREKIQQLFAEFGVPLPEDAPILVATRHRGRFTALRAFGKQLTDEQKQELRATVDRLRAEGKSREEIHKTVGELLQRFGVQLPDNWNDLPLTRPRRSRPNRAFRLPGGVLSQLSAEQKSELRNKLRELREQKATPKEARDAVKSLLEKYGLTLPAPRGGFWNQLTEEQRQTVRATIDQLKQEGKSREEIHNRVRELLQSYGVELPDNWTGFGGRKSGRRALRGAMRNLTQEQRSELKAKIQELKEQGATAAEIRKAVREYLQEHGIRPGGRGGRIPNEEQGGQQSGLQARNFPNPFNPSTTIVYTLEQPAKVLVQIFNVNGQLVTTLVDGEQSAGSHSVLWDGRDDRNVLVPSGLYFYRISTGRESVTRGMILMK